MQQQQLKPFSTSVKPYSFQDEKLLQLVIHAD